VTGEDGLVDGLLPHLNRARILASLAASPGREVESGKFASPESSAALAANTFGFFLDMPAAFPARETLGLDAPALSVELERSLRFPWSGGRHPWLDAVIETRDALVGIESKRYEPFRAKAPGSFSAAYSRPVWGSHMVRYEAMRDRLRDDPARFAHLDAVQLVKHAFGLVNQAGRIGKRPVLVYLHAEPRCWPDGREVPATTARRHEAEVAAFAEAVVGDAVAFAALTYSALLDGFACSPSAEVRHHAGAVRAAFAIGDRSSAA
jgi:hypothetical protein